MGYKISLAGDLGSGKSTVSQILIRDLGVEYYGTGKICRKVAIEMGLDIADMNVYMETHPEVDTMIDDGLKALSDDPRNLIIGYVVDADFDDTGVAKYALLQPATNVGSLEQVFIVTEYEVG